MHRRWAEVPIVLALMASALMHVAALVGPAWSLPEFGETDSPPPLDAVLVAPKTETPSVAVKPVTPPPPKTVKEKSRASPVAAAASNDAVSPAPTFVPVAVAESSPPPAAEAEPVLAQAPKPVLIALPAKGRVRFTITRGEGGFVVGQSTHSWEQDGFTYSLRSVTETTGIAAVFKPARVVQESRGDVLADGLRPVEFRHERKGGIDTASFDWDKRVVSYVGREDPVAPGAQDMLSMYYQAVLNVAEAQRSQSLPLTIATGRKLERYRFDVVAEEDLSTKFGTHRTLHLSTKNGNDTIELWIAIDTPATPARFVALPLKIRFIDRKGEIFDQLAEESDVGDNGSALGEKP